MTHVEGTIFKFTFVETGQAFVVEDSDGGVVARNRGALRVTYLFDTLGDGEPGGVSLVAFRRASSTSASNRRASISDGSACSTYPTDRRSSRSAPSALRSRET